jgi:molybdenum cofactor cytidylyltransferase
LIAAVLLAAGVSSRMGKPKQTLPVNGVPMLERVLEILRRSCVGRVVVVLGANAAEVRERVKFVDELVVVNPRFAEGMSTSLRLGLKHVGREADAVVIALGDQPFLHPTTIDKMVAAYEESRARIVIPKYRGARGNPVLFDKSVFPQIEKIRGDIGAKSVIQKNPADVLEVEVPDRGVLIDIDTPSDLNRRNVRRKRSRELA